MSDVYDGVVVFRDGVHYAVDDDGHADLDRPLRFEDGAYRDAGPDEPLHNDTHGQRDVSIDPSELTIHEGGNASYPVGAHVVTSDGETYYLADEHGNPIDERPLRWNPESQRFEA